MVPRSHSPLRLQVSIVNPLCSPSKDSLHVPWIHPRTIASVSPLPAPAGSPNKPEVKRRLYPAATLSTQPATLWISQE